MLSERLGEAGRQSGSPVADLGATRNGWLQTALRAHELTCNGQSLRFSQPHLSTSPGPSVLPQWPVPCGPMQSCCWGWPLESLAPLSIPRPRWSTILRSMESGSLEGAWLCKPEGQDVNTLWVNSGQWETREGKVPAGEFPLHTPSDGRLWCVVFGSAYLGVFHVAKKLAVSSWSNSQHHDVRPYVTSHPPVTHFTVSLSHSLRSPFPGSHQHLILALGSVWKRTWTKSHWTALLYLKKTSGLAPADTFSLITWCSPTPIPW